MHVACCSEKGQMLMGRCRRVTGSAPASLCCQMDWLLVMVPPLLPRRLSMKANFDPNSCKCSLAPECFGSCALHPAGKELGAEFPAFAGQKCILTL